MAQEVEGGERRAGEGDVGASLTRARGGLDRFTLGIVVGVAALVVVLVGLVLARPNESGPLDEARPAGVVHNYYLALLNDDPKTAYGYLSADEQARVPYERFVTRRGSRPYRPRIRIDDEKIEGDTARVTLRWSYPSGGGVFPFGTTEYTHAQTVVLRREQGAWKLAESQHIPW